MLIVSPNWHGGHYFVGGNDPVRLVSKVGPALRKTTIATPLDDTFQLWFREPDEVEITFTFYTNLVEEVF